MPKSKKRVKKPTQELAKPKTSNIVKTRWGRIVIAILALSFVVSGLALLVYTLVQIMVA